MDARATVSAGTVKLNTLLLQSAAFQATSSGTVTLADPVSTSRLNDLPVGIALERNTLSKAGLAAASAPNNTPYARLPDFCRVSGTLAHPEVKTDALALSRGMLRTGSEAVKGALGAGAAGALGGVLSGAGSGAAGAAAVPAAAVPAALKAAPAASP